MTDQTQFMIEEPMWEPISDPNLEVGAAAAPKLWWRRPPILIGLIATSLLVLLILLGYIFVRTRSPQTKIELLPQPSTAPILTGAFSQRLQELRLELEAAEPNRNPLPFPQVNLELKLEDEL